MVTQLITAILARQYASISYHAPDMDTAMSIRLLNVIRLAFAAPPARVERYICEKPHTNLL